MTLPFKTIYKDNDILIINKPAGLQVHPGPKPKNKTLVEFLVEEYPTIKDVGEEDRPGIVHRLDEETSGLMVVALTNEAYKNLMGQFKDRKIKKKYYALVFGNVKKDEDFIIGAIGRSGKGRKLMGISYDGSGKESRTDIKIIERFDFGTKGSLTFLEAKPTTGRTHQIRVHLKSIGHPIVGDKVYKIKRQRPLFSLNRQFLHAFYLQFIHPSTEEEKAFKIDLPSDLEGVLDKIREQGTVNNKQ